MTAGRSEYLQQQGRHKGRLIIEAKRGLEGDNITGARQLNANEKPVKQRRGEKRGEVE